tara:strand:+ start:218 stop:1159 length:942 start_codon:yes stop_codon:yes gene_type:complete
MSLNLFSNNNFKYWNWNNFKIAWNVKNQEGNIPILLIHGFGASSAHWRNNIIPFAKMGYCVYTIDLLGFGESDQPGINQIGKLDNGIWCDQITDFIREVIRPIHSKKIIIIGNSLGGLVALTCAVAIPEEVYAVIASPLPDPISIETPKDKKRKYQILKFRLAKIFANLIPIEIILFIIVNFKIINLGLNSAYFKKTNVDEKLIKIISKPVKRKTASRALRAMLFGMSTRSIKLKSSYLLRNLSRLKKVPLLLIWGEKDTFIPLFFGKRIANLYPWVKLKIVANSGHCVHDEDHHKFNNISHKWIKELKFIDK